MDKLIFKEFLKSFFTLFFIIFSIISLVFIISISNITHGLKLTFLELFKMYLLSLPQVIFITLPISFFISSVSVYAKFSESYELIAFLSLGIKPIKLLKPIIITSIFLTLLNLIILFISIPYSKMDFKNLKNQKKQEAKFNFKSGEISQQLGNWIIFAEKKEKLFNHIYLYNPNEEKIIIAKKGNLKIEKSILDFKLKNGKIYDFKNQLVIDYKTMDINQRIPKVSYSIFDFKTYMKKYEYLFVRYIPFALIPIAFLFFIPLFGFFHPRLNKNRSLLYSIILITIYALISFSNKNLIISIFIPITTFIIGGILYKWKKNL